MFILVETSFEGSKKFLKFFEIHCFAFSGAHTYVRRSIDFNMEKMNVLVLHEVSNAHWKLHIWTVVTSVLCDHEKKNINHGFWDRIEILQVILYGIHESAFLAKSLFFTQIDGKTFLKLKKLVEDVKSYVEFKKIMNFDFWDFFGVQKI